MTLEDLIRYGALILASVTYAGALANLVVSWLVLRPHPPTWKNIKGGGGGFIWLHILMVAIGFQSAITWAVIEVTERFGGPLTWRVYMLIWISTLLNIGYIVIYRVELGRLRLLRGGVGDVRVIDVR